jgi:nucleotide-binding universal stress UspA family protein
MINKILVAIDGSKESKKALKYSLELAKKFSAKIVMITVIEPVTFPILFYPEVEVPAVPTETLYNYSNELKENHQKMLNDALKKIKKFNSDLKVTTKLVEGRPSDKIIEECNKEKCDLIIIGSRGVGGIKQFLLGSVSDRVADNAKCPVLIIK